MRFAVLAVAALTLLLSGCAEPTAASSTPAPPRSAIADVATSYKSLKMITPGMVFVDPELAMLCRGARQDEIEAARKTKGPHANAAIVIYMNDPAARTFAAGTGSYEPGAVIVKEKGPGSHSVRAKGKWVRGGNDGVGGMIKRPPGFDPAHGDWEYFYFEDPAKIEAGAIASCVKCHEAAKKTDHVFGTWASREDPLRRPAK